MRKGDDGSLRQRVAGSFISLLSSQCLLFAAGILLSRLLDSRTFGAFAILLFWTQALIPLATLGLEGALVRRREPLSAREAGTAFTLQMACAAALVLALWGALPLLRHLHPDLATGDLALLPWTVLNMLLAVARSTPQARLEQALRFRELARLEMLGGIGSQILAVVLAWRGLGLAALVAGMLAREVVLCAGVWILARGPRPALHPATARSLASEGLPFLGNSLLCQVNNAVMPYLGFRLGVASVGYVAWAASQGLRPQPLIDTACRVLYPAYARLQDRKEAIGRALESTLRIAGAAAFVFAAALAALAGPMIRMVYGEKWLPSSGPLVVYALALVPILLNLVSARALLALGESRLLFRMSLATTALFWVALWLLAGPWPLLAAPLSLALINAVGFLMTGTALKRRIPIRFLRPLAYPLLAAASGSLAAWAAGRSVAGWPGLALGAALAALCPLAVLAASPDKPLKEAWSLIRDRKAAA